MNIHIYLHLQRNRYSSFSVGCGLHARIPQPKPLPDVVYRTINGAVMEGAVAMELSARYFVCRDEWQWEKSPPK